jgi:hypothetical protein
LLPGAENVGLEFSTISTVHNLKKLFVAGGRGGRPEKG